MDNYFLREPEVEDNRALLLGLRELPPPPAESDFQSDDEVSYEYLSRNLTPVTITGIEGPLHLGVREAVATCHHAGVTVKMCAGDNVLTTRSPLSVVSILPEVSSRRVPCSTRKLMLRPFVHSVRLLA